MFIRAVKLSFGQHVARRLLQDRTAAAAVEFAIIAVPFIFTLLLMACVALILFMHQQLDYAVTKAARQVMNGTVQKNGYTQSGFRGQVVCSYVPAAFSCGDIIVNLQTVNRGTSPGGYYRFVKPDASGLIMPQLSNATAQYSAGVQGSYEYLQIIYPITFLPAFVTALISTQSYNGVPAYLAVSTAAFRNEQY